MFRVALGRARLLLMGTRMRRGWGELLIPEREKHERIACRLCWACCVMSFCGVHGIG